MSIFTNKKKSIPEDAVPATVEQAIPLQDIYEDGICLVGRNLYSKTYRFTDINYATASREDKEGMFIAYSQILNSFDTQADTKLTINNRRMNRQKFEQHSLLELQGDMLDRYRAEYNHILTENVGQSNAGRYGVEFDGDVTKEIYINKYFAPLDGGYYEVIVEGAQSGVTMQQTAIPEGSEAYEGVVWYYKHDSVMNVDDILSYIAEKGLYTYTASMTLPAGSKLNIKMGVDTIITADHLTEVYADEVCITKDGDYVKILSDGVYYITYLPAYNAFAIHKSEEELPDAYLYCDVGFVALTKDANNVVTYEGLVAEANDYLTFFDGTKTKYLPITLDSNTDSSIAHVMTSEGLDMLFFDKAGTYNLAYNAETGVLSITSVGGDTNQGGDNEQGGNESIDDYTIFISVVDYTNGNQTLYPTKNPDNPNEVYVRVETIAANSYLSVSAMSKADYSSTTYGTLADTDTSVATNLTADTICVKVAGPIDVYFNFETKTIRIVAVS